MWAAYVRLVGFDFMLRATKDNILGVGDSPY
jgi:hypothetical protein